MLVCLFVCLSCVRLILPFQSACVEFYPWLSKIYSRNCDALCCNFDSSTHDIYLWNVCLRENPIKFAALPAHFTSQNIEKGDFFLNWKYFGTLLNNLPLRARGIALVQRVACKMHSKFRGTIPLMDRRHQLDIH